MTSFNPNEFQSNENFRVAIKQVAMEAERNFVFFVDADYKSTGR
jgi:hypothetical protein